MYLYGVRRFIAALKCRELIPGSESDIKMSHSKRRTTIRMMFSIKVLETACKKSMIDSVFINKTHLFLTIIVFRQQVNNVFVHFFLSCKFY
jgi:hypothetical protein